MDALVMCGGRGTRLERLPGEKPLWPIAGRPMVDRVIDALAESRIDIVHAVTSPNAPDTRAHAAERVRTVETSGAGYVADLAAALHRVERPVLTVAADLPLLDGEAIDRVLDDHDTGSTTVRVPVELKRALAIGVDTTSEGGGPVPTGVNVVGDGEDAPHVVGDERFAVNVNRPTDAAVAEALARNHNHCTRRSRWRGR